MSPEIEVKQAMPSLVPLEKSLFGLAIGLKDQIRKEQLDRVNRSGFRN